MYVPLPSVTIDVVGQNFKKGAKGWYTYDFHFAGGREVKAKIEMLLDVAGWEASECSGGSICAFYY